MSFLQENNSQNLAARITNYGRRKIAQGDFNISYFQIGDSEFDYGFSVFDGITNLPQKVLMPLDKDSQVKYPYKVSTSTLTGTTYGIPLQVSQIDTIRNEMDAAGFVTEYFPYGVPCTGSSIECGFEAINISALNGTTSLIVPTGSTFNNTTYITIVLNSLCINNVISAAATSFVYRIVSITTGLTYNTLTLDRATPNLSSVGGTATVICNSCYPESQGDPWILNNIWSQNPAGLDPASNIIDEKLSGYTSNAYTSAKEYFGYNTSSGQTTNTGTTITNSFGDVIMVLPEEQHSLSIIHYSKSSDILIDPDLAFKYEDYIAHSTIDDIEYFEIYIPFIYYERNTGTTIGARFFMGGTDYYINSSAIDTKTNQMKFRYLLDEQSVKVGKIFVNHKVIVIDDQEIVAALDYKSNRRYTLPIPRIALVPTDAKCDVNGDPLNPLLSGTTGQTVYVSYLLQYTGDTSLNGLHCNHYCRLNGGTTDGDVSIKFNSNDFRHMKTSLAATVSGYTADKFSILVQRVYPTIVNPNPQPDPTAWKIIDFTSEIPNHSVGSIINPTNLRDARFIITYSDWYNAPLYVLPDPDLIDSAISPEFGDEQPFTGSVKLIRSTDLEVMRFLINLPSGYFETTQNPSYVVGKSKRITEAALLDENKNVLVIAKASSPIIRTGTQVLSVKIDI